MIKRYNKILTLLLAFLMLSVAGEAQKVGVGVRVGSTTPEAAYYVSATGSDSNDGRSPAKAFKTITKVNTLNLSGTVKNVYFKRGDSFTGTLTAGYSGTSGKKIVYGAYGNGAKPKIYGSDVVTGTWTVHSGNIYKITLDKTDITQLFLDGSKMKLARYPDNGYFSITSVTSDVTFTSTEIDGSTNYTDATIMLRTDAYTLRAGTIQTYSGQQLTMAAALYDGGTSTVRTAGDGFWLSNKLIFLTQAGEWFYDNPNNTLYVWTPYGDSPANYEVRVSTADYGISITSKNYITVKDIEFLHQSKTGVYFTSPCDYITVNNVTVTSANNYGIEGSDYGSDYSVLTNNTITGCAAGLRELGNNSSIQNNVISNTGQFLDFGKQVPSNGTGTAIHSRSDNDKIDHNYLTNCGYNGINAQGLNTMIKYNYINGACQVLDDGGGIYMFKGTYAGEDRTIGSVISNNIVLNVTGNDVGDNKNYPAGYAIYLDGSCKGVTVRDNVIGGSNYGFYSNGGGLNVYRNNICYDVISALRGEVNVASIEFKSNKFYATNRQGSWNYVVEPSTSNERFIVLESGSTYTLDSNIYVVPYSESGMFRLLPNGYEASFASWQTTSGQESHSTYSGTDMTTYHSENLIYNNTTSPKVFYLNNASNITDAFSGTSITSNITLQPFTGMVLKGLNAEGVLDIIDTGSPSVTAFSVPAAYTGVDIPITTFTGSSGTWKYKITESASVPTLGSSGWSTTVPTTYTVSSGGAKMLYAWVRDAAGNISLSKSAAIVVTNPLAEKLVLAYDMEESANPLDDESGNNTVATNSNVTYNAANHYTTYNGTSSNFALTDKDNLTFANDTFSLEMWIYPTVVNTSPFYLFKSGEFRLSSASTGATQVRIYQNASTSTYTGVYGSNLTLNAWNQVITTYDGSLDNDNIKTYKNAGTESSTNEGNETITNVSNTTSVLNMGSSGSSQWFNGNIGVVRVWKDKILSSTERSYLYNSGVQLLTDSLAGKCYYVATAANGGSDANNGSKGSPWLTVAYAASQVSNPGSTIVVGAGTFNETQRINLGIGVSLTGQGDATTIKSSYYLQDINYGAITLRSETAGSFGNQSVSYFKLDGNSHTSYVGIEVYKRSNVKIHHLTITEFQVVAVNFQSDVGYSSLSDPGSAPSVYQVQNEIYSCTINDCADRTYGSVGAIRHNGQDGLLVYDNTLTQTAAADGKNGDLIAAWGTWDKNVKYYHNKFYKPIISTTDFNFCMEIGTVRGGIEIYENEFHNGVGVDLAAYNNEKGSSTYSCWIHDNLFINDRRESDAADNPYSPNWAITVEGGNEDVIINNNVIIDKPGGISLVVGQTPRTFKNIQVYNNVMKNLGYSDNAFITGNQVYSYSTNNIMQDIYFRNNTVEINGARSGFSVSVAATNITKRIHFENNIVKNSLTGNGYGWLAFMSNTGVYDSMYIYNNLSYNNMNSDNVAYNSGQVVTNVFESGIIKLDPLFTSSTDFTLLEGSPAINAGINVGSTADILGKKIVGVPDIGAYESNYGASYNLTNNKTIFVNPTASNVRRATKITAPSTGNIISMSIYFNPGSGNVLLGVYNDSAGKPGTLLGVTPTTAARTTQGWQTINLVTPAAVTSGQTLWLAYVTEANPLTRYESVATNESVASTAVWAGGMPASFGSSSYTTYNWSVYCTIKY